jgi:bifunctional DNA-binding transcriptional regulator/antitoxin component of YhaV-PrlF toxin-antitoxin module
MMSFMKTARITAGGQISIPSAVRRRWGTNVVAVHDEGDHIVLRPLPDDPIAAARGALRGRGKGFSSDELRNRARADDAHAERRRRR